MYYRPIKRKNANTYVLEVCVTNPIEWKLLQIYRQNESNQCGELCQNLLKFHTYYVPHVITGLSYETK